MAIDLDSVGRRRPPVREWWNASHALLYALGIGCGPDDLTYVTENSAGVPQQVLPTFACVLGESTEYFCQRPGDPVPRTEQSGDELDLGFGPIPASALRHGEERLELGGPLPVEGEVDVTSTVTNVWDKGTAAVVELVGTANDAATGAWRYTRTTSLVVQGHGGFGGDRGPSGPRHVPPERPPDHEVRYEVPLHQSLLYRLSHGRVRGHSDPAAAIEAGFERPLLAGMCTYGYAARALLRVLCGDDVRGFAGMGARFAAPVFPGDSLAVKVWAGGGGATFVVENQQGQAVLTQGHCELRP